MNFISSIQSFVILILILIDGNWTNALKCIDGFQIRTAKGNLVENKYSVQKCENGWKCAIVECTSYFGNATTRGCEPNCIDYKCNIRHHSLSLTMQRVGCQACDGQDLCNSASTFHRQQIVFFTAIMAILLEIDQWNFYKLK